MSVEYTNRKDERYTLYEGRTKTGKPKFYCSRKPSTSGVPAHAMPEGYEWRENPASGIVSVRKIPRSGIASFEREMLAEGIRTQSGLKAFIVDIDGNNLVAYTPDTDPDAYKLSRRLIAEWGEQKMASIAAWMTRSANYSPMMRFALRDEDKRLFSVERWCFRGAIDNWIFLSGPAPLEEQIKKYARHLGSESFFELM